MSKFVLISCDNDCWLDTKVFDTKEEARRAMFEKIEGFVTTCIKELLPAIESGGDAFEMGYGHIRPDEVYLVGDDAGVDFTDVNHEEKYRVLEVAA